MATSLVDLVTGNNRLVAITRSSTETYQLQSSPDGITWTATDSPSPLLRLHYTNGIFVAIDRAGRALSSTDGLTWTTTQLPDAADALFFSAAGNGRFLVSYNLKTYVSTNGTAWREVT